MKPLPDLTHTQARRLADSLSEILAVLPATRYPRDKSVRAIVAAEIAQLRGEQ